MNASSAVEIKSIQYAQQLLKNSSQKKTTFKKLCASFKKSPKAIAAAKSDMAASSKMAVLHKKAQKVGGSKVKAKVSVPVKAKCSSQKQHHLLAKQHSGSLHKQPVSTLQRSCLGTLF